MKKIVFIILLLMNGVFAQTIPPPIPNSFIQDHSNVLNDSDKKEIDQTLRTFKDKYSVEFGVALIDSLDGYPIESYSITMATNYGIGSKNNEQRGLLLLIAIKDRKCRFEISRHMEVFITDSQAGTIIRNTLVPKLKVASTNSTSENWKQAILAVTTVVDTRLNKVNEAEQISNNSPSSIDPLDFLIGLGLFLLFIVSPVGILIFFLHKRKVKKEKEQKRIKEEGHIKRTKEREEKERLYWESPEGKAELEQNRLNRIKLEKERKEREAWLKTPEGIEYTRKEKKRREEERNRKRKLERERSHQKESERKSDSSSYSSSSSGYSSSDSSSSSFSSGSSFGGGSDFGGGGSSGSW